MIVQHDIGELWEQVISSDKLLVVARRCDILDALLI